MRAQKTHQRHHTISKRVARQYEIDNDVSTHSATFNVVLRLYLMTETTMLGQRIEKQSYNNLLLTERALSIQEHSAV